MFRRFLRFARIRPRLVSVAILVVLTTIAGNVIAYRHARSMMHFTPEAAAVPQAAHLSRFQTLKVLLTGIEVPRPRNRSTPRDVGLDSEVHHIAVDGGTLEAWFIHHPQPRAIVLLFPGYAGCKSFLLHEASAFHDMGLAALLVDFQGCGGSTGDDTTIGVREADDVRAACSYAHTHWPKLPQVLYGVSMGSTAILRAVARTHLRPLAAVLECPFDRLLHTVENRFRIMGVPSFPGAQLLLFWGSVYSGYNGFDHNPVDYARDVRCPVLFMHGQEDRFVTAAEARSIFDQLAGEKDLNIFPGVGHESCLYRVPQLWHRHVRLFLQRFVPDPPSPPRSHTAPAR